VAALSEEVLGVSFLEIAAADLVARNLSSYGDDGHAVAVAIVKTIDQVQVSRPATARAHRKTPGQMRVRPGGKRGSFLMSYGNPLNVAPRPDGIGDAIEGISSKTINLIHPGGHERIHKHLCYIYIFHGGLPLLVF